MFEAGPRLALLLSGTDAWVRLRDLPALGGSAELEQDALEALPAAARQHWRDVLRAAGVLVAAMRAQPDGVLPAAFDLADDFGAAFVMARAPVAGSPLATVSTWLSQAAALAEAHQTPLLIANHPATVADTGAHLGQLLNQAPAVWVGAAFDPAGFVAMREHPFLTSFMAPGLKNRLQWLALSDAVFENGERVPLHAGNAEIRELVSALLARGYTGYFSVDGENLSQAVGEYQLMRAELNAGLERVS